MNYYVVKSFPGSLMVLSAHYTLDDAIETAAFKVACEKGESVFEESVIYAIETDEVIDLNLPNNILYTDDIHEAFAGAVRGLREVARRVDIARRDLR